MKKYRLTENQYKLFKTFLKEDAESDSQKKAIEYLINKEDFTKEEADEFVRKTFRKKFTILNNNRKVGKFTFGALRIYFEDCKSETDCRKLYTILQAISDNNEIGAKYDRNFNGKSLETLMNEIDTKSIKVKETNKNTDTKSNYKIYQISNFEESSKFSPFTSWCITKREEMLSDYTNNYMAQFYFAVTKGYKDLIPEAHENEKLLGEYGLSMLAICVNPDGSLRSCTCRWNHDKGGNDHCMNIEQIEKVTGLDFSKAFPPSKTSNVTMERIANIEKAIYSSYEDYEEFKKTNGKFYKIYDSYANGWKIVKINETFIYLFNGEGQFVAKTTYNQDNHEIFLLDDFAIVKEFKTGKYYTFYKNGTKKLMNGVTYVDIPNYEYANDGEPLPIIVKYRDNNTKIVDSDFGELFNFNRLKDYSKLIEISQQDMDSNSKLIYVYNITYENTNGEEKSACYDLANDIIVQDYNISFDYGQDCLFLIPMDRNIPKGYIGIFNGKVYKDIEREKMYLFDEDEYNGILVVQMKSNSKASYKYIIFEIEHNISTSEPIECQDIKYKYMEPNYEIYDDEFERLDIFAYSIDGNKYNIKLAKMFYEGSLEIVNELYDVEILDFEKHDLSNISLIIRNGKGEIEVYGYGGEKIYIDSLESSALNELSNYLDKKATKEDLKWIINDDSSDTLEVLPFTRQLKSYKEFLKKYK